MWPDLIRTSDIEGLGAEGKHITDSPGFHMGHFGFNCRVPLTGDPNFRHAVTLAFPKDRLIASIYKYIVGKIWSNVAIAQGGFVNPSVYRGDYNLGDPVTSPAGERSTCGILKAAGYTWDAGESKWQMPGSTDYMRDLIVYSPTYEVAPTSAELAALWCAECNKVGIPMIHTPFEFWDYIVKVFEEQDFDCYLIFWGLGRFPDHLFDFCHSSRNIPWGYNNPGIMNDDLDAAVEDIIYSLDTTLATQLAASHEAQRILNGGTIADPMPVPVDPLDELYKTTAWAYIPVYSRVYFNAFQPELEGIINPLGYGSDNGATFMNARWPGDVRPGDVDNTLIYCNGEEPETLNPCQAGTVYAWNVLNRMLDGLMDVNPYSLGDIGSMATSWEITETVDGMDVTFQLRDDVYWHCGNQYTAYDAKFNWEYLRDNEVPRYLSSVEIITDVTVVNDFEVVVSCDEASIFRLYDIAGTAALLPPWVWAHISDDPLTPENEILTYDPTANTTAPTGAGPLFGTAVCPNQLYGTGAFTYVSWDVSTGNVELAANRAYYVSQDEYADDLADMFAGVGDVNKDGIVNVIDLYSIALKMGQTGTPGWIPEDISGPAAAPDGVIGAEDIGLAGYYYGVKKEY
jgi:peptide/nickel transport system substrate-binding protein